MSSSKAQAIKAAILPRNPRIPSDFALLSTVADLLFCPVKSVERRERADHIARLIDSTLVEAGR